jgi:4'-phosphopantetheinyl transferase
VSASLGELSGEQFFSAWTLLEAAVKATGLGLAAGARDVRLDRPTRDGHCVLAAIHNTGGRWTGRTRRVAGCSGRVQAMTAVVVRGCSATVRIQPWTHPELAPADSREVLTVGRMP